MNPKPPDASELARLASVIEAGFASDETASAAEKDLRDAVERALNLLDKGVVRVAEPRGDAWHVNQWLKQAILLSFRLFPLRRIAGAPDESSWWDKASLKFADWKDEDFRAAGLRAVPGALVRHSAYVAQDCVLMPCFINLGAHVGAGTMIDTWASVGSCAQIGERVHISGGAGIGGVLEPLQSAPVIIEDDCFIGARSEVAEGVIVRRGAVLAMGVFLTASTKIVDRASGAIMQGEVPPYAVVVPGSLPSETGGASLACAVIVKRVDAQTRAKTSITALLRA